MRCTATGACWIEPGGPRTRSSLEPDEIEELARWLLGDGIDFVVGELLRTEHVEYMMIMRAEVEVSATVTALGSEGVLGRSRRRVGARVLQPGHQRRRGRHRKGD